MQLRWTESAAADLEQIADYLFEKTPLHTERILAQVYRGPEPLLSFPALGRPGRVEGTRELVLAHLPYVMIYVHLDQTVHILRVLHAAQKWP